MNAPTMPITMVTMMPRGLGPGVMKRASRPTIRPMIRTPMKPPTVMCFSLQTSNVAITGTWSDACFQSRVPTSMR